VKLSDDGKCRMHLVDRQPWMVAKPRESEGSLLCPGCQSKVGQFNLAGLKCSCGLVVAPAFKVAKQRVDATLHGVDVLEASLLAADLADRGGVGILDDGDNGDSGSDGEEGRRGHKSKRTKGPVSKQKGNFSEFRNKKT
jgi:hypothetical protein